MFFQTELSSRVKCLALLHFISTHHSREQQTRFKARFQLSCVEAASEDYDRRTNLST